MTFWGVEVKPGKPFTLSNDDLEGKLVLTQATLGSGSSSKKSILQCNVGDKSPVYLCTLLPDKTESCSLTLEFDEEDDVVFSVVGPTSIHLSGFVQFDQHDCGEDHDDSDSYGEDVSGTESEDSDYDSEEEYDFIDDDDMYPHSSAPNSGVVIEEIVDDEKAASENGGSKQSQKKKQQGRSDSDKKAQQEIVMKGNSGASLLESEDEDGFPVSSSSKSEPGKKNKKQDNAKDGESAKRLKRRIDAIDDDEELTRIAGHEHDSTGTKEGIPDGKKNKKKKKGKALETETNGALKSKNVQKPTGDSDATNAVNDDSSEGKTKKKKNKKAKTENGEAIANTGQGATPEAKKIATADKGAKQAKSKPSKVRTFPNGFIIEEVQMGKPDGRRASKGRKVSVRYIGKFKKTGQHFDSNIGGPPFKFRLGVGQVIKGWDVGVEGMRVGDKRRLTVPPAMGYGKDGHPPTIPPNAWLVFDVELIDVA